MTAAKFIEKFRRNRFDFTNEKKTQAQLHELLMKDGIEHEREKILDDENIPDFFFEISGLCVEIKIKGSKTAIYRQLERYSKFDEVKEVVLMTNKAMSLPKYINNKPAYVFAMSKAWL
jgi:hypothetical protein